ncbi:MAG: hypothetical protein QOJ13_2804 [Gaiellales bacterium]|jgi:hypothetical protein|nr:hypothetical protein [Gaiellales bacterium]
MARKSGKAYVVGQNLSGRQRRRKAARQKRARHVQNAAGLGAPTPTHQVHDKSDTPGPAPGA